MEEFVGMREMDPDVSSLEVATEQEPYEMFMDMEDGVQGNGLDMLPEIEPWVDV